MPDLSPLLLRTNPSVFATGGLIKGLYYSEVLSGLNAVVAFYMACDRVLKQKPFLIVDFRSRQLFLDGNLDGCIDAVGTPSLSGIDPADFIPAIGGTDELCRENLVG
jgi:hypothetical protein